jgi:PKD repeat protein
MSTKTTFKRIALVAVAALGLGVLTSVAPASAAVQSDALTLSATTGTAAIGETATATMSLTFLDTDSGTDTMTATVAVLSSPATSVVTPTLSISTAQATANTAGTTSVSGAVMTLVSAGTAAGRATGSATMSLVNLAVAGVYVIRVTPGGGLTTTAQTFTLTVAAKPTLTAAASTVLQGYDYYEDAANVAIRGAWAAPSTTTDALKLSCYAYPGYSCARIKVTQSNGSTTNPLVSTDAVPITATVTGPGLVEINDIYPNYTTQPKGP